MKALLAILTLSFVFQISSPSFIDILHEANTKNKPILLVFSGSDWCANCIKLKTNVFDQEGFKTLALEQLVMYTADFPRSKKAVDDQRTLENEILADKYNPKGQFPLVLLLDNTQKVLKKTSGKFNSVDEFKVWLSL